jgi:hypothetical protein
VLATACVNEGTVVVLNVSEVTAVEEFTVIEFLLLFVVAAVVTICNFDFSFSFDFFVTF